MQVAYRNFKMLSLFGRTMRDNIWNISEVAWPFLDSTVRIGMRVYFYKEELNWGIREHTMKGQAHTMKKKKRYLSREEIMAKLKQPKLKQLAKKKRKAYDNEKRQNKLVATE